MKFISRESWWRLICLIRSSENVKDHVVKPPMKVALAGRNNLEVPMARVPAVVPVARWTVAYTRVNCKGAPVIYEKVHLDFRCSGMAQPHPIMLHESCVSRVPWCKHCCHREGTIFGPVGVRVELPENDHMRFVHSDFHRGVLYPDLEEADW